MAPFREDFRGRPRALRPCVVGQRLVPMLGFRSVPALVSCLSFAVCVASVWAKEDERPNIVLIYADDLGWMDAGYAGSDFYETPRIDGLAREGLVMTSGYAPASMCAPSRAALLAGQYPARVGFYGLAGMALRQDRMRVRPVYGEPSYPSGEETIAEALRDRGYVTGMVGKWQLEKGPETSPTALGFSFVHEVDPKGRARSDASDPKRLNEISREVTRFLEQNKDRPFFLYVSHLAVHTPIQARPATIEKYAAKEPGRHHRYPPYAAMVENLDQSVGRLLDTLGRLGLDRKTLVVLTSDNGAASFSPQAPLRGQKGSFHEGGIRVPMIARWPGRIEAGTNTDVPVSQVDLFPTFLDAAGATASEGKILDGESLLPLFRGGRPPARESLYWHAPSYMGAGGRNQEAAPLRSRPVSVVRKGSWKLLLHHEAWALDGGRGAIDENGAVELYDLANDIGEQNDLARTRPDKRDELLDDLLRWIDENEAPLADRPNPRYEARAP